MAMLPPFDTHLEDDFPRADSREPRGSIGRLQLSVHNTWRESPWIHISSLQVRPRLEHRGNGARGAIRTFIAAHIVHAMPCRIANRRGPQLRSAAHCLSNNTALAQPSAVAFAPSTSASDQTSAQLASSPDWFPDGCCYRS